VLENFSNKSAFDLEAITTLDYVASKMFEDASDADAIISKVQKIKGSKFSTLRLEESFQTLKQLHYI